MKKTPITIALAGLVYLIFIVSPSQSLAAVYQVTKVLSGDTIRVEDGRGDKMIVRLAGIDTPKGPPDDQPFSQRSKRHLESLVQYRAVEVISYGFDDAGRILGVVFADNRNVNVEMVQAGLADVDRGELSVTFDLRVYRRAEREAAAAKRGMWAQGEKLVPPRDWTSTSETEARKQKLSFSTELSSWLRWILS